MESISGEITLYDLIAWEPRLHLIAPQTGSPHWRSLTLIEVDWILAARSTRPMLSSIRGGELIVLSDRIVREIDVPFAALMREISSQPIAGILTDHPGTPDTSTGIPVLHIPVIDGETERDLNRLLTNGRREALQRVAEVDQAIAESRGRNSSPATLADRLSQIIAVPIAVQTSGATPLISTNDSSSQPQAESDQWLSATIRDGYTLWLGPIPPARHAIARMSLGHIREGMQRAFETTQSHALRGTARVAALNALLRESDTTDREAFSQQAMSAGVPPDRALRIVRASTNVSDDQIRRMFAQWGDILDAGEIDGHHIWLLASRSSSPLSRSPHSPTSGTVAISGEIDDAADLPVAMQQAEFLSKLLENRLINARVAVFDDAAILGIYALLHPEWGSPRQDAYRIQHLGPLLENDPRGMLLETLGVYLDQGGSQRLTAEILGIHRNTLSYRLRQINSLLPVDLSEPHTRLTLHVAVAIHRIHTL